MGSIVFTLMDEGGAELSVATVYASLGLPSDALEQSHANLLPSPCSWELFDIQTTEAQRRWRQICMHAASCVALGTRMHAVGERRGQAAHL